MRHWVHLTVKLSICLQPRKAGRFGNINVVWGEGGSLDSPAYFTLSFSLSSSFTPFIPSSLLLFFMTDFGKRPESTLLRYIYDEVLFFMDHNHNMLLLFFLYLPPPYKYRGVHLIHFVHLVFCLCVWFCLDDISWTAQPFLTKLGMVVYYHESVFHAEKLVHYLQCQGHSEGLYNQHMTISSSTISPKLLVCLQPNLVW